MTKEENKLEILRRVENGTLTIEEGSDLIGMLDQAEEHENDPEIIDPMPPAEPLEPHEASGCWKAFWSMFLVSGAILMALSIYWIYLGAQSHPLSWGFWLSWIPLIIGVALLILGWALLDSPWMHVRVRTKEETKDLRFVFSMPVPFNLAKWSLRNFGGSIPGKMNSQDLLDVIEQAEASIKKGEPFQVQVDDKEDGSKVDIFIN